MSKDIGLKDTEMINLKGSFIAETLLALVVYSGASLLVLAPVSDFSSTEDIVRIVSVIIASLSCYALSCRWVDRPAARLLAGGVYGLGPWMLSLLKFQFHAAAMIPAAVTPLTLIPAAFISGRWDWTKFILAFLPAPFVWLFFYLCAEKGFFPMPIRTNLLAGELAGIFVPLVYTQTSASVFGIYHVMLGILLEAASRTIGKNELLLVLSGAAGIALSMTGPFFGIPPLIWLSLPSIALAVLAAQAAEETEVSRKINTGGILLSIFVTASLAMACLLASGGYGENLFGSLMGYRRSFALSAKLYLMAAVTVTGISLIYRFGRLSEKARMVIVMLAAAADIAISAAWIVPRI